MTATTGWPDDQPAATTPGQLLTTLETVAGQTSVSVDVTLSVPVRSILIVCYVQNSQGQLKVIGKTTGAYYADFFISATPATLQPVVMKVAPEVDPVVTVSIDNGNTPFPTSGPSVAILGQSDEGVVGVQPYTNAPISTKDAADNTIGGLAGGLYGTALLIGAIGAATGTDAVMTQAVSTLDGAIYSVPSVPGVGATDHPPVELQIASLDNATVAATVIAAPPAGQRIRVFYAQLTVQSGTSGQGNAVQFDHLGGMRCTVGFTNRAVLDAKPTGVPLPAATALSTLVGGTLAYDAVVIYTVETV